MDTDGPWFCPSCGWNEENELQAMMLYDEIKDHF